MQLGWSPLYLSLLIDHLVWIRFHQSVKSLSHVLCTNAWPSMLVFCLIFKLSVFNRLNGNVFVTRKVKRWRKLGIVAVLFSSSLSWLSLHAHKCIYENNWTRWAKGVQARMQVDCHWILSFVLLLANSSSSIQRNRIFQMLSFKAGLHGTTLSHTTSLRQAYDMNCFV